MYNRESSFNSNSDNSRKNYNITVDDKCESKKDISVLICESVIQNINFSLACFDLSSKIKIIIETRRIYCVRRKII